MTQLDGGRGSTQTSASPPTATPITDLANQYTANSATGLNDSWQNRAASSPPASETPSTNSLAVQYQSGYGGTSDSSSTTTSSGSSKSTADHSSDPPARINAYDAQSVESTSVPNGSPYGQTRSLETTPVAGLSNSAQAWRDSASSRTEPSYSSNDPFSTSNANRSTVQTSTSQTVGTQRTGAQAMNGQMPVSQPAANSIPVNQFNSSNYGVATSPIAAVVPQPAVVQRNGEQYTVQPNDSYWTISEKVYGTGGYFKALYEYNRKRSKIPDELKLGQVLLVPEEGVLRRSYPDLCPKPRKTVASGQQRLTSATGRLRGPGRVYTVTEGDTLFEIARHELGKPARWAEIYELNREVLGEDTDFLRPGTELILPTANESGPRNNTAIRQPAPVYSR
jgi:LysM repeat protein